MKRLVGIITALGVIAYFGSCKKINCETPVIAKALFYSTISTSVVTDTSVTLVKARKGTSFGQVSQVYANILLQKVDFNKRMDFPDKGVDTYDYDWMITMHPSNKVYKITKISHQTTTSKTSECTNTVTYYVNDSLITVPGNPYSNVPNFVSDIQLRYN